MQPREIAVFAADTLDAKKGIDVKLLEVTEITVLADYFVVSTATSSTHLQALTDELEFKLKERGIMPRNIEGHKAGGWILMDYGTVIVHVFTQEAREFYALERLWSDAVVVNRQEE
ncbi:MAG: ribosome silencing factor [Oscillospiraceae bacterium]|nr:ribosome silencing factor [Oscillospiraceae bacterium]